MLCHWMNIYDLPSAYAVYSCRKTALNQPKLGCWSQLVFIWSTLISQLENKQISPA